MAFCGGRRESIAIATASHWSGPFTITSKEPVFEWMVPDDWPPSLVTPGWLSVITGLSEWTTGLTFFTLKKSIL